MEYSSLAEKAYHALENLIVTLELPPGQIFSESELSEKIDLGRTPMREALLRLSNEKLVEMIPRRGIAISDINITNHIALLETRAVLDHLIAKQACKRATITQREKLKQNALAIEEAAKQNDVVRYMDVDKDFDTIVADAARNQFACEATTPLHSHCRRFWLYYNRSIDLTEPAKLHADLMLAIASGEEELASQATTELLNYLKGIYSFSTRFIGKY